MHDVSPKYPGLGLERPSLTQTLEDRYNNAPALPSGRPTADGRTSANAKNAGVPIFEGYDGIPTGNGEFKSLQYPGGIANDNRSVQVFTWTQHGGRGALPVTKYAMSGRL